MVRNLGGDITLHRNSSKGTTLKLNLPRDLRAVMATQTEEPRDVNSTPDRSVS